MDDKNIKKKVWLIKPGIKWSDLTKEQKVVEAGK